MAFTKVALVKYTQKRSCFLAVPHSWSDNLAHLSSDVIVFEVNTQDKKKHYLSWNGEFVTSDPWNTADEIEVNSVLANRLGLVNKTEVVIQRKDNVLQHSSQVYLQPTSLEDWQILSLNADYVEGNLMNQIRVIWSGMTFPVWVQANVCILVQVAKMSPDVRPALLVPNTEVIVMPNDQPSDLEPSFNPDNTHFVSSSYQSGSFVYSTLKSLVSSISSRVPASLRSQDDNIEIEHEVTPPPLPVSPPNDGPADDVLNNVSIILKAVPLESTLCGSKPEEPLNSLIHHFNVVFISSSVLSPLELNHLPSSFIATLKKHMSPLEKSDKAFKARIKAGQGHNTSETSQKTKSESSGSNDDKNSQSDLKHHLDSEISVVRVCIVPENGGSGVWDSLNFLHGSLCVLVPEALRRSLGLEFACKVHLDSLSSKAITVNNLVLHPVLNVDKSVSERKIIDCFKSWIKDITDQSFSFVLCKGTFIQLPLNEDSWSGFFINLNPRNGDAVAPLESPEYAYLDSKTKYSVQVGPVLMPQASKISGVKLPMAFASDVPNVGPRLEALGGIKELAEKGLVHLHLVLSLSPLAHQLSNGFILSSAALLITGAKGSGKTTLAKSLCRHVSEFPNFTYIHILECQTLRGKRTESVFKEWEKVLAECIHRQPSVLVFDDLDLLCTAPAGPEQENTPDAHYFFKVAEAFLALMSCLQASNSRVAVIVTSSSWKSLHPKLTNSHGKHVFYTVLEIQSPNNEQRCEILQSLISSRAHLAQEFSSSEVAAQTEGCVARDLEALLDRATHSAWLREGEFGCDVSEVTLTDEDFETALEDFCPTSLRGLDLRTEQHWCWEDVGGLQDVKDILQETFLWPVKYPKLFANSPLKPLSGLLLYGAPGTGKTLLAGVVASECQVNFISIKGPELLSKYIGASELAVRNVFQRAQSAKPCIIFFDEFDSIAPRRGHDSTGVTDRVVNQLLTLLDGVETMPGVYVLAATSRPDLIDPALLRPGRLDRSLHCPLPNKEDRLKILKALSRKLALADDIDLEFLAEKSEFFTGADLQALLYTAQLEGLHEVAEPSGEKNEQDEVSPEDVSADSKDYFCMWPLESGVTQLPSEERRHLEKEIQALQDNVFGGREKVTRTRKRSTLRFSIHQRHLLAALQKTKPSVSPKERFKFQVIYDSFTGSPGAESETSSRGQRVTLA